jgi:hypothetical protein
MTLVGIFGGLFLNIATMTTAAYYKPTQEEIKIGKATYDEETRIGLLVTGIPMQILMVFSLLISI